LSGTGKNPAAHPLERYYRLHARVYDATRWTFLFGRRALVRAVAGHTPVRVLEVGCGTGTNLAALRRRLPGAVLTGVDLSTDMLARARRRLGSDAGVELVRAAYDRPIDRGARDVVVFSYVLSMMNPGWERALDCAAEDLRPGGLVAVVDFHDSLRSPFRRWMALNHVRMEGHLLPALQARFRPVRSDLRTAYGGVWRYLLFVGERP
jgi:S-adenosylmethionine-diacylgycerolhomoserine-N-methlytransferase